jgi:hypothetical protein
MRLLPAILFTAASLFAISADAVEPKVFNLGVLQPGMRLGVFRYAAHPAGVKLVCSQDEEKPKGADRTPLELPKAMTNARVNRCALFGEDEKGLWAPRKLDVAGTPSEYWIMAIEDDSGTERIYSLTARQSIEAFDKTALNLTERWGPPAQKGARFVHWNNSSADGQIADDGEGVSIFLYDIKLQEMVNTRIRNPSLCKPVSSADPNKPEVVGKPKAPKPEAGGEHGREH